MATDPSSSRLGRGLGSMFDEVSGIKAGSRPNDSGFMRIPIADIRESIYVRDPDAGLTESIKRVGVLHPILVAREGGSYRLLAGSRRLRAAREAGLADVPALVIPPDRAGALDVFLEENLTRTDLSEAQRRALRDQWMRETGRDEEQAAHRIPEPPAPAPTGFRDHNKRWRFATVAACLLSIGLIIALVRASERDTPTDGMDRAVDEILAEDFSDTSWMEAFAFPGSLRDATGETLTVSHNRPAFSGIEPTRSARIFLYQLAALLTSTDVPLSVTISAWSPDYDTAASRCAAVAVLLRDEGVPEHILTFRPHAAETAAHELELRIRPD